MGRSKRIQDMRRIDRLSDLPDSILHHILSFIDTKSSVQTCILSSRWRSVWKYVDVLTFSRFSLKDDLKFERYVDRVLSLRYDSIRVSRVAVNFWVEEMDGIIEMDLFDRIMKYSASHGVQELYICNPDDSQLDVVESLCSCHHTLKVLEFECTYIGETLVGLWSCLQLLESLTLTDCNLIISGIETNDVFANFPVLESLRLVHCYCSCSTLKVTGSKLLNLEVVYPSFDSLQIVAPKLQSFSLEINPFYNTLVLDVDKLNLPSLDRANIKLLGNWHACFDSSDINVDPTQKLLERCANLFKILHNVQAINLQVETFELLIQMVKHQAASPFKRMKLLNLKCSRGSHDVPDQVIHYFLGGSPKEEDKHFTVK
ncbi:Putative F-box/LRR-repeat protein At5g02930 [Linum perenne]